MIVYIVYCAVSAIFRPLFDIWVVSSFVYQGIGLIGYSASLGVGIHCCKKKEGCVSIVLQRDSPTLLHDSLCCLNDFIQGVFRRILRFNEVYESHAQHMQVTEHSN